MLRHLAGGAFVEILLVLELLLPGASVLFYWPAKRPAFERTNSSLGGPGGRDGAPLRDVERRKGLRLAQAHVDLRRQKRQAQEQKERADRPLDENHDVTARD